MNRLLTAETTSTYSTSPAHCWGEAYFYDNQPSGTGAWGNLTGIGATSSSYNGCTQEGLSVTANTNNQVSGFCYDAAGNLLQESTCPAGPPYTYTYNAEHQITSTGGVTYSYDGNGKRIEKSGGEIYWYGGRSTPLDETDLSGDTNNSTFSEHVYFGGIRTSRRDYQGNIFYYFADHLGTSREMVQSGQTSPCYDADFYPFGGERAYTTTCTQNYKFTGKERDSESGLDNFGARCNASSLGRFLSPDPIVVTPRRLTDPQRFNLNAYTRNNPLRYTDPTGMDLWEKGCGNESATCHGDYVGTWDKDHKNFTRTTIQTDSHGNIVGHQVNFDSKGIHIDGKFTGVFASNTQTTVVNGTGAFEGFQGIFNTNCRGTCAAGGILTASPGHSFGDLIKGLRGPNEYGDHFSGHQGDQYRGGNREGTDIHLSFVKGDELQDIHFDWRFPFGSWDGLVEHSRDVLINNERQKTMTSDPPDDLVKPAEP